MQKQINVKFPLWYHNKWRKHQKFWGWKALILLAFLNFANGNGEIEDVLRCRKLRCYLLYNLIFPSNCSIFESQSAGDPVQSRKNNPVVLNCRNGITLGWFLQIGKMRASSQNRPLVWICRSALNAAGWSSSARKRRSIWFITKSISRFGRNTLDMLWTLRILNDCDTEVYFGEENIWLCRQHMKVLLTAHCVLAQAKSENMSRDIKWGIKLGFQNRTSV